MPFKLEVEAPSEIRVDDTVTFTVRLTSLAKGTTTAWVGGHAPQDIFVEDIDGRQLWRWSVGIGAPDSLSGKNLDESDYLEYSADWTVVDNDGVPLAPGVYFVVGALRTELGGVLSNRVRITVLP